MTKKTFHGAFIFRNQGYGILSSTYLNNYDTKPYPETAILKLNADASDAFLGTFETVWLEKGDHYKCHLTITLNDNLTYNLEWIGSTPDIQSYNGLGILENGILVGCYWGI